MGNNYRSISAISPRMLDDRSLVMYLHKEDHESLSYQDIYEVLGVYFSGLSADTSVADRYIPRPLFSRKVQYPVNFMVNNEYPQGWVSGVQFPSGFMASDDFQSIMGSGIKCDGLKVYVGPLCDDDCESYMFVFNDSSFNFAEYTSLIGNTGPFNQISELYTPYIELIVSLSQEKLTRLPEAPSHIFQKSRIKCDCSPDCQTYYIGVEGGFLYTSDRFESPVTTIDLGLGTETPSYTIAFGKYLYTITDSNNVFRIINDTATSVSVNIATPKYIHQDAQKFWWIIGDGPAVAKGTTVENATALTTTITGKTINCFTYDYDNNEYLLGASDGSLIRFTSKRSEILTSFASAINTLLYLDGKITLIGLNNGELWEIRNGGDPKFLIGFGSSIQNIIGEFNRHILALGDGDVYLRDLLTGKFTLFNSFSRTPLMSYCLSNEGYTGVNHILFIDDQDVSQAMPCK